ncbi:hypothetical protein GGS20DRAFT_595597 [Poronia punctata]|nr:hypothetical protein GGS20DRAFT_595597 [Poronia punctata]
MVGVAGKYKGCNTCRARRVKCDNTRPFCRKCTDYNRECGGYERETVFIVGTQNDRGRVGSHPPRNPSQTRAAQPTAESERVEEPEWLAAVEPSRPGWDETVLLDSQHGPCLVRIFARHADLETAIRHKSHSSQRPGLSLSLLDAQPLDVSPTFVQENFNMKSSYFFQWPAARVGSQEPVEGICLFLYQQNSSTMYHSEPAWNNMSVLSDSIREAGPAAYQTFPAHHFFTRVYRPSAVWAALLNRQPTYLCNPEWTVVPYEQHPRTCFDELLDIVVLLPSIYSRADAIIAQPGHSLDRQSLARELLEHCASVEAQFDIWFSLRTRSSSAPYWRSGPTENVQYIPFNEPLSFASPLLCLAHLYYWAVLTSFHQCVYVLLKIHLDSPDVAPISNSNLDPRKYHPSETRKLAALVCRSLDFALQTTTQPDLLLAPVWIVSEFYNDMMTHGLCELESLWVEDYRQRWEIRSQEMSTWLEGKQWSGGKQIA